LTLISVFTALFAHFGINKNKAKALKLIDNNSISSHLGNISHLADIIVKPDYQKFDTFLQSYRKISKFEDSAKSRLLLVGPSGRGKTATAEALIEQIKANSSGNVLVLRGESPHQEAHLNPYAPLHQALGHITGINFNSINDDNSQINSLLDSVMDSIIPFSSLLLPEDEGNSGLQSRDQLNELIFNSLVKMCKKANIILFLDDLQWVDDSTRDFLIFLNKKMDGNIELPLLLILTSREERSADNLGLSSENLIMINPLQDKEKELILSNGLGFNNNLSHELLKSFGNISGKDGEMFYLLSTLSELAREEAFKKDISGYVLSRKFKNVAQLPIPDSFADSVMEQLKRLPDDKMIIECAACIGLEFEVDLLVKALSISRLDLLHSLNNIESETDLIYDVGQFDDVYAFSSSAVLEVIRKNLRIFDYGPLNPQVPQIIREYHARLGSVMMDKKGFSVFAIANHLYAAGRLYADKAIGFCIKSAHSAAGLFQHENARKYLKMAKECAEISNLTQELTGEFLKIEISESLVINRNQKEIADRCWEYLKDHLDVDDQLNLLICKSFYNAGLASGDQEYFQKAEKTACSLAEKSKDNFVKAECKQLIAISLPRNRMDEIVDHLKHAYSSLMKVSENSMRTKELLSRIENSLAERLSYGSEEEKKQAEELFLHSINIKEELMDKPGLARSWGGLGRLHLELNKIPEARECFEKDLAICRQIGDKGGEVKMFSFIADCYSRENDFTNAATSYKESYQLADNLNDKLFAARGLITVGLKSSSKNDLSEFSEFLIKNRETALDIWSGFFDEILTLIKNLKTVPQWAEQL